MEAGKLAGLSILVVEDHDDLRDALSQFVEQAGAEVRSARNGIEALAALRANPLPDAIVCDLHMPGMDGCEFLIRLRDDAGLGYIPVIALTGQPSEEAMLRTLEVGFDSFVVKPILPVALVAQIRRVLRR
jgi:two-component system, cell cycle response regulator DivK